MRSTIVGRILDSRKSLASRECVKKILAFASILKAAREAACVLKADELDEPQSGLIHTENSGVDAAHVQRRKAVIDQCAKRLGGVALALRFSAER